MISCVIVSLNEAQKLESCLETIADFADEIVVLDLESTDNSKDVAKKYNAKLLTHKAVEYVEKVRNFAISKTSGDWVLILDPDESLSEKLKIRLKELTTQDKYVAINIPRKNIFFGKWIAHTNWWPDRQIRFFRKEKVEWREVIHSYPKVSGEVLNLPANESLSIIHLGYSSIRDFLDRQNRYSTIDAQNRYQKGERFSFLNLIWRAKREFLVRYIKHQGFLDGFYGFALVILMMVYQVSVCIKIWELEKKADIQ